MCEMVYLLKDFEVFYNIEIYDFWFWILDYWYRLLMVCGYSLLIILFFKMFVVRLY